MYNFIDTTRYNSSSSAKWYSDDEFVIFENPSYTRFMKDYVPIFSTIKINGLNDFNRDIEITESSFDGDLFGNSRLPSKEIEIEFLLQASSQEELITAQRKMQKILFKENLEFTFNYLKPWKYTGTVTNIEFESGTLKPSGKIIIKCPSPYRKQEKKNAFKTRLEDNFIEVKRLKFTVTQYPEKPFTIYGSNSTKINIAESKKTTEARFELTWKEDKTFEIRRNGSLAYDLVLPNSNIGTFQVAPGGNVYLSISTSYYKDAEIYYNIMEVG